MKTSKSPSLVKDTGKELLPRMGRVRLFTRVAVDAGRDRSHRGGEVSGKVLGRGYKVTTTSQFSRTRLDPLLLSDNGKTLLPDDPKRARKERVRQATTGKLLRKEGRRRPHKETIKHQY